MSLSDDIPYSHRMARVDCCQQIGDVVAFASKESTELNKHDSTFWGKFGEIPTLTRNRNGAEPKSDYLIA